MREISKCCKGITNTGVDQSAYYGGISHLKGIDFSKFRKQAQAQLKNDEEDDQ